MSIALLWRCAAARKSLSVKEAERAKASGWRSLVLALAIVGLAPVVKGADMTPLFKVDAGRRTITIGQGMSLRFADKWALSGREFRNAVELIAKGARGTDYAPEARTLITVERRLNHAEAVDRLGEIASTHGGTAIYRSIGGWPAMQLRYRELLPEPTERRAESGEPLGESVGVEERTALHTTTAIAVEDTIVRLDTTVAPKANEVHAREAEEMARKLMPPARGNTRDTLNELKRLRALGPPKGGRQAGLSNGSSKIAPVASAVRAQPRMWGTGVSTLAANVGGFSETEAGVSTAGVNMIVGSNSGTSISNDGGMTFTPTTAGFTFPNQGDPSVAVGRSGNFYLAMLGLPGAASRADLTGLTGCSASVISSGNHGAAFAFAGNAALCPATGPAMCFPDQEHIAADRVNASPGGGDQLYAVWRNHGAFSILGAGLPANCDHISVGGFNPSLSCSTDSGSNWSAPLAVTGTGDFPRVAVGGDGFVYVVILDGGSVMIHKYPSCSDGLVELPGFPRLVVSGINDTTCPLPGLDRCHQGLIVPTAAIDDMDPSHIYVAVTKSASGSTANDDILVIDSVDGGVTWRAPITVNGGGAARRFMPWICAAAGNAYVGWYDRRAAATAGAATNDLTDFFLGAATLRNGQLVSDGERNLTGTPDAQCANGWPGLPFINTVPPRSQDDSEKCTTQPQLAGVCQDSGGGGSNTPCDYSSGPACPFGESCRTGGGTPKYGDYNGIACGPDRVLATWASATAPAGFTGAPPSGITVFSDVRTVNGNLTVEVSTSPPNDAGRFNVLTDGTAILSSISNGTAGPINLPVTARHLVGESAVPGTSLSNYSVAIDGDCDGDGTVHFSALHPATCRITNVNLGDQRCLDACNVAEGKCMSQTRSSAQRQECHADELVCARSCSPASPAPSSLTVVKHLVPTVDSGKFNLTIDGIVHKAGAGDGSSTPPATLAPGVHSVGESAAAGTSLSNYTTTFGGGCGATGEIVLNPGDRKTCEITNTRKPGTGADAQLTVKKVVIPASTAGRFNLLIDGTARASNIGNGGTTGAVVVLEGTHKVDETEISGGAYTRGFSGDCDAGGNVTLMPGDHKTCTITNTRDSSACIATCNVAEGTCMAHTHDSADRQECVRDMHDCVRACSQ